MWLVAVVRQAPLRSLLRQTFFLPAPRELNLERQFPSITIVMNTAVDSLVRTRTPAMPAKARSIIRAAVIIAAACTRTLAVTAVAAATAAAAALGRILAAF